MQTMFGYTANLEGYTKQDRIYRSYTQFRLIFLTMELLRVGSNREILKVVGFKMTHPVKTNLAYVGGVVDGYN